VTKPELAYLVYPELPVSRAPYRQPPEIAWLLMQASTGGAISKLVNKAADRFELLGYRCAVAPEIEGAVTVTRGCVVRVREDGTERELRLFGRIVERGGRWRFLGLDGDL
jgi:hypothetical protein